MGKVQGQLNALVGTAAAAIGAAKHTGESASKQKEQGLLAEEQYHEAEGALKTLGLESKEAKANVGKAEKALKRTKEGSKANKKRMSELEAAQVAFNELQDKIKAKEAMRERATLVMKRTGVGGER